MRPLYVCVYQAAFVDHAASVAGLVKLCHHSTPGLGVPQTPLISELAAQSLFNLCFDAKSRDVLASSHVGVVVLEWLRGCRGMVCVWRGGVVAGALLPGNGTRRAALSLVLPPIHATLSSLPPPPPSPPALPFGTASGGSIIACVCACSLLWCL